MLMIKMNIGVGERHFEKIIGDTLRHVILIHTFPRSLIQLTLQVVQTPRITTFDARKQTSFVGGTFFLLLKWSMID